MSTFDPSASARPFVISGIALAIPPVPVLVPTPAPVPLNQVSSVNRDASKDGAAPKVTNCDEPSKASAFALGGGAWAVADTSEEGAEPLAEVSTAFRA